MSTPDLLAVVAGGWLVWFDQLWLSTPCQGPMMPVISLIWAYKYFSDLQRMLCEHTDLGMATVGPAPDPI